MLIRKPNNYEYHSFCFKITSSDKHEPRFLVLSSYCLHNVEVNMTKTLPVSERPTYVYKKELWLHPIEGLVSVDLNKSKKAEGMHVL